MSKCDIFVFHDNVEQTKNSPTRRTKILSKDNYLHWQWLTIPLQKHSDFDLIKELRVSNAIDWRAKHLRQIETNYKHYPNFLEIMQWLRSLYHSIIDVDLMADINIKIVLKIADRLEIRPKIYRSSELPVNGKSDIYNAEIVSYLQGSHYISGIGGNNYQLPETYHSKGIELVYLDSKAWIEKVKGTSSCWYEGHSIIEPLMLLGFDGVKDLVHRKLE